MSSVRRGAQSGFTLLELIVSFVVFAFAFAAIMASVSHAVGQTRRAAAESLAALYAQSHLDALAVGEKIKEGVNSGRFDDNFRWSEEIRRLPPLAADDGKVDAVPAVELVHIALKVTWKEGSQERAAEFITMRAIQPDAGNIVGGGGAR